MVSYVICNTKHLHQFPQSLTKTSITFESQYSLLSQVASRFVPSSPTFTLYHVKKQHEGSFKNKLLHWLCEGFSASYANSRNFHTAGSPWAKKSFAETFFALFGHFGKVNIFISKWLLATTPSIQNTRVMYQHVLQIIGNEINLTVILNMISYPAHPLLSQVTLPSQVAPPDGN